ncbi:hypothetical protein JOB18_027296 [Solea senegalensis]|uniref:Immunoglobulin V-set domain-containing protein n=1 Tax=Solea senegalensis TaxID=28829 RepID=A0AAV6T7N8_SOLSE|nr:hypothetical protein JOB18_027296 [Solea senegalensis]
METVVVFLTVLFVSGVSHDCQRFHLFITVPQKIQALTGSCVWIPCSFETQKMLNSREEKSWFWMIDKKRIKIPGNLKDPAQRKISTVGTDRQRNHWVHGSRLRHRRLCLAL